jgi:DNA-directed RNA polymerase specialized sigma24 family protein
VRWLTPKPAAALWSALGALPAARRMVVEGSYFGGLSHIQITRVLGVA